MCFNVFLYGKIHVSYIFYYKKNTVIDSLKKLHLDNFFQLDYFLIDGCFLAKTYSFWKIFGRKLEVNFRIERVEKLEKNPENLPKTLK
jgi:hypothetical protein